MYFSGEKVRVAKEKRTESEKLMQSAVYIHARAYIEEIVESDLCDKSAYMGEDKSLYLPYRRVGFFYGEYDYWCKANAFPERAQETTFRKAFKDYVNFRKEKDGYSIKLSSGKGSFDRCEICHNAEQLLGRSYWYVFY